MIRTSGDKLKFIALVLILSMLQLSLQTAFAMAHRTGTDATTPPHRPVMARVTTRGNQKILVNGISTNSDATVLSGAAIETPDAVGATIDISPLGTLDLAPNTKVSLVYEQGQIKVTLIQGCTILRTKEHTSGAVETPQGPAGNTSANLGGTLDVCFTPGTSAPIANQGAATTAGAGAQSSPVAAATATSGGGGAGKALPILGAIGVGGAVAALVAGGGTSRGSNPSSSTP